MNTRKWLRLQSEEDQAVILAARKVAKRARHRRANKLYQERHPERVQERTRRWRAKNAGSIRERNKRWKAENPETHKRTMALWRTVPKNRMKSIVRSRIADAKRRGIAIDISALEALIANPPTHCAISGMPLDYSVGRGRRVGNSPSIDRIDASRGYVAGNIAVTTHRMNTIKSFGTAAEHRMVAEFLERHNDRR